MSYGFRSVRGRYILTGFAICAVSLLLVSLSSYFLSLRIVSEQMEERLRESGLRNAAELDAWFRGYGEILEGLAEDLEIRGGTDPASLLRLLRGRLRPLRGEVFDLYFGYGDPAKPFLSAVGWVPDPSYDCRDQPWYVRAARTDSVIFTEPYRDAQTGGMVITVARAVRREGRLVGVLAADIRIAQVVDRVRRYRIGEGGYAFLLDDGGNFVSHPCRDFRPQAKGLTNVCLLEYGGYAALLEALGDGPVRTRTMRDYDGREVRFVLCRIPSNRWVLGIALPKEEYRKPLRSLMGGFGGAFLISLLLGTLIMLRLVDGLVRPIRSLTGSLRAFSEGNLGARSGVDSRDEIGELGRTFNRMAEALEEYGRSLENKVEERTRELQERNARIRESIEYAKTLQEAILPDREEREAALGEHVLLWEPRDTVGGDFYWLRSFEDSFLLLLGDCTGHGVPGALMSMTAKALLDRIVAEEGLREDPAALLNRLNELLDRTLRRGGERNVPDGLDAGVLFVDRREGRLRFAGAGLSLLVVRAGEVREIRGDRWGLGFRSLRRGAFALREEPLPVGATLYLATDGFRDQVGGPERLPFGRARLIGLLASLEGCPLEERGARILKALADYRGEEPVRDDMTLIGFRV